MTVSALITRGLIFTPALLITEGLESGSAPPPGPGVVYSGDGWGPDEYRKRARKRDEQLREIRSKRDREREQLAIDLRAAVKSLSPVRDVAPPTELRRLAKNVIERPTAALFPLVALLQDIQRTLLAYDERARVAAAIKQALEAEQRATLIAAYERILADAAIDEDDEEAIMMILAEVFL